MDHTPVSLRAVHLDKVSILVVERGPDREPVPTHSPPGLLVLEDSLCCTAPVAIQLFLDDVSQHYYSEGEPEHMGAAVYSGVPGSVVRFHI